MSAVLSKQAGDIVRRDIEAPISEQASEDIRFKESLPARGSRDPDPWIQAEGNFGNRARNEFLKEISAFANAVGSALVPGIAESASKPPIAERIAPLPRCAKLAARFGLAFRECVEPQLPTLDIVPVPTDGDKGVIVFRTGRSRLEPDRVTPKLVCPIRRTDRCNPLGKWEIQDMALNLAHGTERLEWRLSERSRKFEEEFKRLESSGHAFGFRMAAIPVSDELRFGSVYSRGSLVEELRPPEIEIMRRSNDRVSLSRTIRIMHDIHFGDLRPMLQAVRVEQGSDWNVGVPIFTYAEIHTDVLLEWVFVSNRLNRAFPENPVEMNFDSELPVSMLARPPAWADHVRRCASAPAPINRSSKLRRTELVSEATNIRQFSSRSDGMILISLCILWWLRTKSAELFPDSKGISGTTSAKIPVGGVGSHWSFFCYDCICCRR